MAATTQNPFTWGTGRRKTAVARVRIREGTGSSWSTAWTTTSISRSKSSRWTSSRRWPLTDMAGRVDVFVNVNGSGKLSQSGAVLLGLARALKEFRPDLEAALARIRVLDPRRPNGRTEEVRPQKSPQELPVLEAVIERREGYVGLPSCKCQSPGLAAPGVPDGIARRPRWPIITTLSPGAKTSSPDGGNSSPPSARLIAITITPVRRLMSASRRLWPASALAGVINSSSISISTLDRLVTSSVNSTAAGLVRSETIRCAPIAAGMTMWSAPACLSFLGVLGPSARAMMSSRGTSAALSA